MPWAILLSGLLLLAFASPARADCDFTNQSGVVTFAPPATITLPAGLPVGSILWTSSPIVPANYPTLACVDVTHSGVANQSGGASGAGDDTLFPTSVPGLSYRLLHPDAASPLHAYPNELVPAGTYQFSVATALQLVVTGTITPGSVLAGGQFAQWSVDMCDVHGKGHPHCSKRRGAHPVETFSTSSITFTAPACTVTVDPVVVTLPTILASAFVGGIGSTTGQTPFDVQLTCSGKVGLAITLATSNPQTGATGVIAPTRGAGYAQDVGVQVLDGSDNPVSFGKAFSAGQTANGPFEIPFSARYYQTGANVSGGKVAATATYTLTYQ